MPLIEGIKTGQQHFVTASDWDIFKQKGLDRRYKLIDDGDIGESITVLPEVPEIIDSPITSRIDLLEREDIRTELDDLDIEYNPRTSTDKLRELLKQHNDG